MRVLMLVGGCVAGLAVGGTPDRAAAQGAGCAALAGISVDVIGGAPSFFGSGDFDAGDRLNFRFVVSDIGTRIAFDAGDGAEFAVLDAAVGSFFGSVTLPTAGSRTLESNFSGTGAGGAMTVTFLGCGDAGAPQQALANQASRAIISDQAGLVLQRLNNLSINKPANRAGAPTQTAAVARGSGGLSWGGAGAAGQGADTPFSLWLDGAWTGLDDDDAQVGSDGYSVTITGGADTALTKDLTLGAAITFGVSRIEQDNTAEDRRSETSIGFTPYVAYQIDDVFSVQAAAGYNYGGGRQEIGGVDGKIDAHRYFVAGEASAFQTYGDFALFSSVGVLWGRSLQRSYDDDAGTEYGAIGSDLGSVSVTAQPSYLIEVDASEGFFVEPFLLGQYAYDFTITKTSRSSNDRDAFVIGGGANLFHADGLSGTLEASRTLGREDRSATTARGTIRLDF